MILLLTLGFLGFGRLFYFLFLLMKVNSIYTTFQGEVNPYGIGAPVHFLRLQGCHLRCYLPTLGVLCDTPEGLEKKGGSEMSLPAIIEALNVLREKSGGVSLVCLSGGDPLWRSPAELDDLFGYLARAGYQTVVETSGTLSMQPFRNWMAVSWVLDYKVASAGVKGADNILADVPCLNAKDFIKFVLHDEADYVDFLQKYAKLIALNCKAKIAVGVFWQGKLTTFKLVEWLIRDGIFGAVHVNMQAHKALLTPLDNIDPKLT